MAEWGLDGVGVVPETDKDKQNPKSHSDNTSRTRGGKASKHKKGLDRTSPLMGHSIRRDVTEKKTQNVNEGTRKCGRGARVDNDRRSNQPLMPRQTRTKENAKRKGGTTKCGKVARAGRRLGAAAHTDKSGMKRTGKCGRIMRADSDWDRTSRVPIRIGRMQSMGACVSARATLLRDSHVHAKTSIRYEQRIFANGIFPRAILVPYSIAISQKISANMFHGEEDFVLPAQRTFVPPEKRYVVNGWEEAVHQAPPRPIATPSPYWLRKKALRVPILDADAARQVAPAPQIGGWLQSMAKLPQRCFEAVRGGFRWMKAMVGGKRKLVAVESCEAESSTPSKRARLESANEAPAEVEDRLEGQLADEDVNPHIELPDYGDIGYGVDEDDAATEVILGADDEFNAEPIAPVVQVEPIAEEEEPIAEEEAMEVEVAEVAEAMEVDDVDAAGNGDAIAPIPEASVFVPPVPANDMPQPAAPRRRYGPRDPRQFAVIQKALGRGFEVQLLANGTVKLVGVLPGFDRSSLVYRKAASGGYIITAPFRSRFTHVAAGSEHAMLLTSKNRLMTLGSNAGGQLGTRRLVGLARVASQTLGSIERGPIGTAKVKFVSIMARGTESWAWDKDGWAWYCGTANDGSWRQATFKKVEVEAE